MTVWNWLFDPAGLSPHGFCLVWNPGLIGLYVVSDLTTAFAYFSIPVFLARFARMRPALRYNWILYLFALFILACGTTHVLDIVTLWIPAYGFEGVVKLATAIFSVATAIALWQLIPKLAALPSPGDLEQLNEELRATIRLREQTTQMLRDRKARLRAVNADLEQRVLDRTSELAAINQRLSEALDDRTAALSQRDLLLRETYHRVKNNLQIVDGLIVMMARRIDDAVVGESLADLRHRIYALGLVHQQLMASTDLETFDINPFLVELAGNVVSSAGRSGVSLTVDAQKLRVNLDFAIPVGLIVTELVANSMKHASSAGGVEIAVRLTQQDSGPVEITVADNGRRTEGAPAKNASSGIGSHLINGLIRQLGGEMKVSRDAGWRTDVFLPKPVFLPKSVFAT